MYDKRKDPGPVYPWSLIHGMTEVYERLDTDGTGVTPEQIRSSFPKDTDEEWRWMEPFTKRGLKKITFLEFWKVFCEEEAMHDYPLGFRAKV